MQMQGGFDANQFTPKQMQEGHPVGKFPFTITSTAIEENKEKNGGFLKVEFTTPAGVAIMRYNLWNNSAKAVEIAHGQLSALCHATGIFRLDWQNEGAALRGGKGQIEIGHQRGEEPTPEKPQGGYTEIKKVFDINGNEPGKSGAAPQPQQQGQGQWGNQPSQQQQPQGNAGNAGWGNAQPQQQQQTTTQPQQQLGGAGWQQGPTTTNPPWKS